MRSGERLSFDEIIRVAQAFRTLGVKKLRVTGGEPLLRQNLPDLIGDLSRIDGIDDLALTTNGILLGSQAAALKAAGMDRVTVSLDSLDDDVFALMSGNRGSKDRVLEGIHEAIAAGLTPIKINAVVKRGLNDHTVLDLLDYFRGTGVIVRFNEFMYVGTINHWRYSDTVPAKELADMIDARWPIEARDRNYHGEVANRYEFRDGGGEIGFIQSVTRPFCGDCTRARLSSDGKIFTCLFADHGIDLRAPLRSGVSDEELLDIIRGAWRNRDDRYSELRAKTGQPGDKVEMYYIGG